MLSFVEVALVFGDGTRQFINFRVKSGFVVVSSFGALDFGMVGDSGLRAGSLQSTQSLAFLVDLGPERTLFKFFSSLSICNLLSFEIEDFALVDKVIFKFFVFLDSVFGQKFA